MIKNFYTEELPSDLFKEGENVLAIHAMNRSANSSDFILGLQLWANVSEDDEGNINGNWEGTGALNGILSIMMELMQLKAVELMIWKVLQYQRQSTVRRRFHSGGKSLRKIMIILSGWSGC